MDKQLVLRQKCVVNGIGILNIVDGEVVFSGELIQPYLGRIYKGLMDSARFGERNHPELRFRMSRGGGAYGRHAEERRDEQACGTI